MSDHVEDLMLLKCLNNIVKIQETNGRKLKGYYSHTKWLVTQKGTDTSKWDKW